jgi:hypothetical protein
MGELEADSGSVSEGDSSTSEEIQDEGSEAEGTESEQEAVDYSGTMHKIKVDGGEQDVSYEDMVKSTQLDKASYKRMEDASKLQKQMQPLLEILKAAKAGDTSVLKKLGIPKKALREFSEQELLAAIEEEERTPDAQRAFELEEKNKALEAEKKRNDQREFQQYQRHLEQQAATKIQDELEHAFKEMGIPLKGNQRLVARCCEDRILYREKGQQTTMVESLRRSLKNLDDEFSEYARREYEKDPDSFLGRLPENIPDGIRKRSLKEVRSQVPVGGDEGFQSRSRSNVSKVDKDFRAYMRKEMQSRRG